MMPMHDGEVRRSRKESSGRTRVTRACDICKRLKAKCDGQYPCSRCVRVKESCQYNLPYKRGRLPNVPRLTEPEKPYLDSTMPASLEFNPSSRETHFSKAFTTMTPGASSPMAIESNIRTGGGSVTPSRFPPVQETNRSQYFGDASGMSFSSSLRNILVDQNAAEDSLMAEERFSAREAPDADSAAIETPTHQMATTWVNTYFDFAMPTYRLLHRTRVMRAINRRFSAHVDDTVREQDSLFYAIYALGVIYERTPNGADFPSQNKELAAKLHREALRLRIVRNRTFSIVSAQAEFLTCLYYLTMSMFAEAWMAVGSLARSLQAIGLHRSTKLDSSTHFDCEDGRRLFWCAYCLDRYLSAMLGRPNAFSDRDIDAEFPTLVSDTEENEIYGLASEAPCLMTAALAHFRLARIVGCITSEIYGPSCKDISQRQQLIVGFRSRVKDWAEQLPAYLSPHSGARLPLLPAYARQASVLNLAYWHAILSLHRSYVVLRTSVPALDPVFVSEAQDQALEAAQSIATAVRQIHDSGHYTFGFWFTSYIAFSASLVMIVSTSQLHPSEIRYMSLDSSIRSCMLFLESVGRSNRVTDLYFKVVQNIRNAVRQNAPQVQKAVSDSAVDFDWSWFDETFAMNQATNTNAPARQHIVQDSENTYLPMQYNTGFFQSPADMLEAYVISTTT